MKNYFLFSRFRGTFLFLFLIFILPVSAAKNITLDHLTQIALQNNKDLQVVKHNVEIAIARLTQAGQLRNPRLNMLNSDDKLLSNEGDYARSIGVSQEFPVGGRIGSQENVARVDIEVALAEIKNAERKLKGDIASAFYTLLIISYRIEKMNTFLTVAQKLMEVTRKRYKVAEISQLDVNTAQLEHERLLQERNLLETQLSLQKAKLNGLLGRSACSPLDIDKEIPKILTFSNLEDELNLACKQRPDLRIAELSINRAKADSELAHAQKWEDWTVGVGVEQDFQVITGAPPQQSNRKLAVNVSIPLPLLNRNEGRIRETAVSENQALAKLEAIKLAIQTEVKSSYSEVQTLKNIIDDSEKNFLELSKKNALLAQDAYSKGQISFLEVVQAQRQQHDLQLIYLTTLDQYLQALVKLQTATGQL